MILLCFTIGKNIEKTLKFNLLFSLLSLYYGDNKRLFTVITFRTT